MSSIRLPQTKNLPKNPEKGGNPAIDANDKTNKRGFHRPPCFTKRKSDIYTNS